MILSSPSPVGDVLAAGTEVPAFLAPTAALVVAAAVIGYVSVRVRVVPIVGFLVAGVVIGPAQTGLVDRQDAVQSAADIGVILLLFTIGIEFSIARLNRIRRWILLGGGLQVLLTVALTLGVLAAFGVGWREGVFTGFLVALSSTAIVLKLLGDARETSGTRGQLALALLIFQDLAVIVMVLLLPLIAGGGEGGGDGPLDLSLALVKAVGIIVLVLVAARRVMPPLLERVARTCSPEVFLLAVVAICFGTAYLTALAGVSVSLGAFLAGLVVSESRQASHAFGEIMPLQILFSAVFFVSVGMLLDVGFVVTHLPLVLGVVLLIVVVKTIAGAAAISVLRVGAGTMLGTALLLAQIGEFSFVLVTAGADAGLSPFGQGDEGGQAFIGAAVLLLVSTPLLAALGRRSEARLARRARPVSGLASAVTAEAAAREQGPEVVVLGWGSAARSLALDLAGRGVPLVVTTLNPDGGREAEAAGHRVVSGDPTKLAVLEAAGVPGARVVVVADDEQDDAARIASVVRGVSAARIVVRPVGDLDLDDLVAAGADKVVDRDRAGHRELSRSVLAELGAVPAPRLDPTAVFTYRVPTPDPCPHMGAAVRPVLPSAVGCEDCLRIGATWVHLRICLTCGHVGCCDSSPYRHARVHAGAQDHPVIASVEPGEAWAYCFEDETLVERPADDPAVRTPERETV